MTFRTMVFAVLAAATNLPASAGVFTNDYSWVPSPPAAALEKALGQ